MYVCGLGTHSSFYKTTLKERLVRKLLKIIETIDEENEHKMQEIIDEMKGGEDNLPKNNSLKKKTVECLVFGMKKPKEIQRIIKIMNTSSKKT